MFCIEWLKDIADASLSADRIVRSPQLDGTPE
jgi:hypothetical protein